MLLLPKDYFSAGVTAEEFDAILAGEGIERFSLSLISGRCGSTYLAEVVKRCGLGSGEEPFKELPAATWHDLADPSDFAGYLRKTVQVYRWNGTLHIQITPQRLIGLLELIPREVFERRPISVLLRRDLLAQALSFYNAMRTGRWHSHIEVTEAEPREFEDDQLEFLRCLWIALEGESQCDGLLLAPQRAFFYEDIVGSPFESVTAFLEWHEFTVSPSTIREALQGDGLPTKLYRPNYEDQYARARRALPSMEKALRLRRSAKRWVDGRRLLLDDVRARLQIAWQEHGLSHPSGFRRALETASDEVRTKALILPDIISSWVGGFQNKRVLDFGCGGGLIAAGIAMGHNPEVVYGVDINREAEECLFALKNSIGATALSPKLVFEEVVPGDVGSAVELDLVYAWSVFEHVSRELFDDVVAKLHERLKPGGQIFVQISPLYFSPEGSHLWGIGYSRWEHLLKQVSEVRRDIINAVNLQPADAAALWSMFETLNRITADELVHKFTKRGFELVREQLDETEVEPPSSLRSAYTLDALRTFQVVALFRKR